MIFGFCADVIVSTLIDPHVGLRPPQDDKGCFLSFRAKSRNLELLRTHGREEQHVLDSVVARHEHGEAVDADADARGGRHAVFERAHKVIVDVHRLVVALGLEGGLLLEALELVDRVVQLGVGVRQLLAGDEELEPLGERVVVAAALGERGHLHGIVDDEGGLDEVLLAVFAEDGVNELAHAHFRGDLDVQLFAGRAKLCLVHALDIDAGIFLDRVQDAKAAEGALEGDVVPADGLVEPAGGFGHLLEHLLGEIHHPLVVLVRHVQFHAGELRVVGLVHALVAEVLRELVHAREAAHDEALQVQLVRDAEIHVHVQRVVVRDERARGRAARDGLQDRGFHLQAAGLVEVAAHRGDDLRPLDEGLLHLRVHHEVHVPLAVAELRILEAVVHRAVGIGFHDGEDTEGLGQDGKLFRMDGKLARLGNEGETLDADDVADVQQLLEYGII